MAATHTKDLRTGKSLWLSRPLKALPQHFLRRDLSTDVLVVGAGISGALIADQLSDAGMHVTIVDTIASTWALATRPQPRRMWDGCCFIWEASAPYLYLRAGPNGEVICGGEDEEFSDAETRDRLAPAKFAAIEAKLARLLPSIDTRPAYAWCGTFGGSATGTPSIGAVPHMANCYAVLGYGGNGITFSMMAAQMVRTTLEGRRDPDSDLFSFSRRF